MTQDNLTLVLQLLVLLSHFFLAEHQKKLKRGQPEPLQIEPEFDCPSCGQKQSR